MSSGYRPPARDPQGAWARHIHAIRRQRGWSQTRGFEELRRAGMPLSDKSRSAYIRVDTGERQPKPEELPYLIEVYGEPGPEPEPVQSQPTGDISALVAALNRQADAINALVTRLESLAGDAIRDGVEDALREAGLSPAVGESQAGRLPGQFV